MVSWSGWNVCVVLNMAHFLGEYNKSTFLVGTFQEFFRLFKFSFLGLNGKNWYKDKKLRGNQNEVCLMRYAKILNFQIEGSLFEQFSNEA